MIDARLLFDTLAAGIFLIISIYIGGIFFRNRTKHNLAMFIIFMIFLIVKVLDLFLPGNSIVTRLVDSLGVGMAIRILLVVIFWVLLFAFMFYPNIKRFHSQRKNRNQ